MTPYTFTSAGMPVADLTEALDIAARSAGRDHGVRMAYIFDIAGEYGGPAAFGTLEHALTCPPEALVGFGLAGIEQARPRFAAEFRSVFASAIAAGLHSVPHAGEMSGPATIAEALDGLHAKRIGHGISGMDDPALVARLRESQVPLEVCPTSNVCTGQVPGLAAHPLPRMLAEGLFVTLNSDDPPMFGTTLTDEYRRAASVLGLSRAQLAGLAANGVRASFLDAGAKQALLAEIDAVATDVDAVGSASADPESGDPVISVDSKKREKAGNFGQDGRERAPAGDPVTVRSRDFPDRRQHGRPAWPRSPGKPDWTSRSATSRPARASGTGSGTGCSARSASPGAPGPWPATTSSSTPSAASPPRPGSPPSPSWTRTPTPPGRKSATSRCATSRNAA